MHAAAFPLMFTVSGGRAGIFEQVRSHVPPHLKTKRRFYLLQAEAAVTRRIKYHLKLSSVSHNRGKNEKREKKGRLSV